MLENYYKKPESRDRIRDSWLAEPIERYLDWLVENRYAERTYQRRISVLMHFAEYSWYQGAREWSNLPEHAEAFVEYWVETRRHKSRGKKAKRMVISAARVPVMQLLRLITPDFTVSRKSRRLSPFIKNVPGFFDYLGQERGLSEESIVAYTINIRRFESYLNTIDLHDLGSLSPAALSAYITHCGQGLGKNALNGACTQLRVFLRYLYRENIVASDLSTSVDCPRLYRLSSIPRSITWDDVRVLLEAVDQRAMIGKRDYAMLLLLVTYGLRAREVAALTLDDVDWAHARLQVPDRKAGHNTAFPLAGIVGEAIVNYLQQARPESSERSLFLCSSAPFRAVSHCVVSTRTSHYLRKAGIQVSRPGSHTLRHTCVQRLVEAQFPLKTIGDYIGHGNPRSTEIYTKIDIEGLREVAMGDGEVAV